LRRALLIYNPAAGRQRARRHLPRLLAALAGSGYAAEPAPTAAGGDATRLAREGASDGRFDAVLVLGGDGTVRETAVGLLGSATPLGILPGGTANVLARALGVPGRSLAAAAALGSLAPRSMDVGLCGATPFLMMASSGLDAEVMATVDPGLKAALGAAGVAVSGVRGWWRYSYPPLSLAADGEPLSCTFAAVCNIPLYGGPFRLAPEARWDDGQLDLVLFRGGRGETLSFAWDLVRGRASRRGDVVTRRVREVVFETPPDGRLQVDGDHCREVFPVTVGLHRERLQVLARR
jgi:YegS/Rv2252/BmrU family lipid kinase